MFFNEEEEYQIEQLPNDIEQYDIIYKIGIFGDNKVGKTSLIKRAVNNEFSEDYEKTEKYAILNMFLKLNNDIIKLQIWDISSDNSSISFLSNQLHLAIICYSIENKESFQNIEKWLNFLKHNTNSQIKIFLVGNKSDLNDRVITLDEGENFQQKNSLDFFIENSAKNGYKSKNIFIEAVKCLCKKEEDEINLEIGDMSNDKSCSFKKCYLI